MIQYLSIGRDQYCINPNDLFRTYLEYTSLLPYQAHDWGFYPVTKYMNTLIQELQLKIWATGYCIRSSFRCRDRSNLLSEVSYQYRLSWLFKRLQSSRNIFSHILSGESRKSWPLCFSYSFKATNIWVCLLSLTKIDSPLSLLSFQLPCPLTVPSGAGGWVF